MYAGGGALIDRLGTRRGFLVIMVFWSLACASHALADRRLDAGRRAGSCSASAKAAASPRRRRSSPSGSRSRERSTAMGIINAGTAIGAVVAPPAIAPSSCDGHWRWVFCRVRRRRPRVGRLVGAGLHPTGAARRRRSPASRLVPMVARCSASVRSGAWSSPSSSPTPRGFSTSRGCRSISTTRAAST